MSGAIRIFSKFKELLDVSWASIADGQVLKRSGLNIIGTAMPQGPVGPQGPAGVAQVWKGDWVNTVVYQPNDAVSYQGSTFIATTSTVGSAPVPTTPPVIPPLATTASRGTIAALPASNQANYYARGDNTWQILPAGTYVVGPATSVSGNVATYADTTGKLLASTSPYGAVPVGGVLQTIYREYTANTDLTVQIPTDDTVPQWTEGTEVLTAPITPVFSTSKILASFETQFTINSGSCHGIAALFRDQGTPSAFPNAIAARANVYNPPSPSPVFSAPLHLRYLDSPSTTSALTYRIRVGMDVPATMRLNGYVSGRALGGAQRATLVLQEIR